jgi:hypothetical protein
MSDLDSLALDLEGAIDAAAETVPGAAARKRGQRVTRTRARNGAVSVK